MKTTTGEKTKVAVSGGFDPIHSGHIALFREAAKLGELWVILNSDAFLERKKGKPFMPYKERKAVIQAIRYVSKVVPAIDTDDTVCASLERYKPDIFANGGDRTARNTAEWKTCTRLGIKMVFNVGGTKAQSSSWLLRTWYNSHNVHGVRLKH